MTKIDQLRVRGYSTKYYLVKSPWTVPDDVYARRKRLQGRCDVMTTKNYLLLVPQNSGTDSPDP
ncbi:hypothetical protein BDV40DRAFT_256896 [Aspergillus tamarii]|uniref:Uncharacterized protein n=1 Tax=Aspergillus tamarii TaxID=41984 RepID=A0A5N6V5Z3_ASPTM|nr:hypothetical protein BDV40DRAFT_256896 [Aspergillus tamarii]